MRIELTVTRRGVAAAAGVLAIAGFAWIGWPLGLRPGLETARAAAGDNGPASREAAGAKPAADDSVELTESQLKLVKAEPVAEREFTIQRETVGRIAFNDDMSVPVFSPYQGRITKLLATAGDDVKKGQPLYEIDSPDLVQAESTLIAAAGTYDKTRSQLDLATRASARAKLLYDAKGIALKDVESAENDQRGAESDFRSAEGGLKAARDAVRIFGKTDAEIARIVSQRRVDSLMPVRSPIDGRVTARNAAPGLFVQPGNAPAPYTVSDVSTMWMLANVPEVDIPLLRLGQDVDVKVMAYPGRLFHGKVVNIGASVDPDTHRILVRSEIADPGMALRPQMFANFVIRTGQAMTSPAVPLGGVVREGDGTMTVWVTNDLHRFTKRTVKVGLQQDGVDQILSGLEAGELVATDGALFLSNALTTASR
ncbi:MAG: efflux RND transporter periplasmic adaptor subunit [Alphaproteobacteria bacterium]|nr:efflux RND transporter periplasmic adaptor subunit [Alphaproteobacteria bacterium]